MRDSFFKITTVAAMMAAGVWTGGLVALGVIAAPLVFEIIPAPWSADAMTLVFRRFDIVATECAIFMLLPEMVRALSGFAWRAVDRVRGSLSLFATALAFWQKFQLSPTIERLHRSGAVRGLGELGAQLNATHRLAEWCGKAEILILPTVFVLLSLNFQTKRA